MHYFSIVKSLPGVIQPTLIIGTGFPGGFAGCGLDIRNYFKLEVI